MDISTLQNIIRFILGLLLALLPLHIIVAQEAPKTEKKLRIKYIEYVNGVETVKDTTIAVTGNTMSIPGFSGLKADTTILRKLGRVKNFAQDTTHFRYSKKLKAYKLSDKLSEAEREALVKELNALQRDSILNILLKSGKLKVLSTDSLRHISVGRVAKAPALRALTLDTTAPNAIFRIQSDSINILHFSTADSLTILKPAKADRIYIRKNGGKVFADSLVHKADGKVIYRIITNDSTGGKHVLKMGETGDVQLLPGKAFTIFINKVTVQDLTAEDKSKLKKTGTPVESKPKEELELEQIEYYPNPNNGKFNLSFKPENKGTTVVRVLDSKGKEVFIDTVEKLNSEYSRQIDLTPFGKGLYYLQIAQGKRYHTKKILVR